MNVISEILSYDFIRNALIVGILLSLSLSLLGTNLVLKKYSMIGDGLAHVAFGALSVSLVLNLAPLLVAIPITVLTSILLLKNKHMGDAAIALTSSTALAIGIVFTSINGGLNTDVSTYMFGSILALSKADVVISIILSIIVICSYFIFYHKIFSVTFDEDYAKTTGINVELYQNIIAILTAICIVMGMRMMGTLLISSLIVFPSVSAMKVCKNYKSVVLLGSLISVLCFIIGLISSYVFNLPVGASIILVNATTYILLTFASLVRNH